MVDWVDTLLLEDPPPVPCEQTHGKAQDLLRNIHELEAMLQSTEGHGKGSLLALFRSVTQTLQRKSFTAGTACPVGLLAAIVRATLITIKSHAFELNDQQCQAVSNTLYLTRVTNKTTNGSGWHRMECFTPLPNVKLQTVNLTANDAQEPPVAVCCMVCNTRKVAYFRASDSHMLGMLPVQGDGMHVTVPLDTDCAPSSTANSNTTTT